MPQIIAERGQYYAVSQKNSDSAKMPVSTLYPGMSYIFSGIVNKDKAKWAEFLDIPFDDIYSWMKNFTQPVWGAFKEITGNKAFREVRDLYFQWLFFNNECWLKFTEGETEDDEGKFTVYQKTKDEWQEEGYRNVYTGELVKYTKEEHEELLIECYYDGKYNKLNMFEQWYKLAYWYLQTTTLIFSNINIGLKSFRVIESMKMNQNAKENAIELMKLWSTKPYIQIQDARGVLMNLEKLEIVKSTDIAEFMNTFWRMFDRIVGEMGRVTNLNPKNEKLTTGENYKDIIGTATRQHCILESILHVCDQLKDKYDIELQFEVIRPPEHEEKGEEAKAPQPSDIGKVNGESLESTKI